MTINLETKEINKYLLAYKKIQEADNILLLTHERPDGDACSSMCALIDYLENINKKYLAFSLYKPSEYHKYLPHVEKIITNKDNLSIEKYDLIIALDCGCLNRTGILQKIVTVENLKKSIPGVYIIEFDHHPKCEDISDLEIRNTEASSTTEILYYFFKLNKIKFTKNVANCILSGIIDDTDSFLHPNTTDKTTSIASEMLMWGAQYPKITKNKWFNKSLDSMKLWGIALSNLQINKKYNLAFSILKYEHTKNISDDDDIYTAIANYFSSLYGVKGVLFLREEKEGLIKGSLRSVHPTFDVSKIAKLLGGGGHPKSSGFSIEGKIENKNNQWRVA